MQRVTLLQTPLLQWLAMVEGQQPLPDAVEVSLGAGAVSITLRFYHKDMEY